MIGQMKTALSEIGVDVQGAIERCMQDEELYETLMSMFMQDDNYEGLMQALKNKNYQKAYDCAHTLKGVAGNVGFDNILKYAVPIMMCIREGNVDQTANYVDGLRCEYEKTIAVLRQFLA